jgi:hypothetical protein
MLQSVRSHLTYANVMASAAVFVSLGGASYAAITLPKNSVGARQIKNNSITGSKVKNRSLNGADIKNKSLTALDFNGSIQGPPGAKGDTGPPGPIAGTPAGGALSGTYPAPTLAPAAAPVPVADNPSTATDPCAASATTATMVLCGTSSQHWNNGGFGLPGLEVWRDQIGQVHIRGSATLSSGTTNIGPPLFLLAKDERPTRVMGFPVVTGPSAGASASGSALLIVYPDNFGGYVSLFNPSNSSQPVVHVGEITFRTDA